MGKYEDELKSFIKNSRGLEGAKKIATDWFISKSSTKNETSVVKNNKIFVPGKIYVFTYKKEKGKDKTEPRGQEGPKYIAVVLSLGHVNGFDVGIDLNYLPDLPKIKILDKIYTSFNKKILSSESNKPENAIQQTPLLEFNEKSLEKFTKSLGLNYAIRKYETSKRKDTFLLSYEAWKYIPLLNLNKSNASVIKIQKAYLKYINK